MTEPVTALDPAEVAACAGFSAVLSLAAKRFAQRAFLRYGQERWSFEEFDRLVNRVCRALAAMDVRPGQVVSAVLRNSPDYLALYFACLRLGAVFNPFPAQLAAAEVLEKARVLSPRLLFCHKTHAPDLTDSGLAVRNLDQEPGGLSGLASGLSDEPWSGRQPDPGQVAVLYYSSGTTGKPKIIEYAHGAQVAGQASMLRAGFARPGGVHMCVLPLGHTSALRYTVKQSVCTGSEVVLQESFWAVRGRIWQEIAAGRATFMQVVPSILVMMLSTPYPDFTPSQAASLDFVGCGSAFLPVSVQTAFQERFGVKVANLYGLSETGATHFDDPRRPGWAPGSIGTPFDVVRAKVFLEDGDEAPPGQVGQIGIAGPTLLAGYHQAPETLHACMHRGHFLTGDLGCVDRDGLWRYVDRIKDIIIKGGVNIAPSQVEEALLAHPAVEDAAVIGRIDPMFGETVLAVVVTAPETQVTRQELIEHCRQVLGAFKSPSSVVFVESLPKGPSGKILKRELRLIHGHGPAGQRPMGSDTAGQGGTGLDAQGERS